MEIILFDEDCAEFDLGIVSRVVIELVNGTICETALRKRSSSLLVIDVRKTITLSVYLYAFYKRTKSVAKVLRIAHVLRRNTKEVRFRRDSLNLEQRKDFER